VQAGTSKGTGFFLDRRLLLTCAHVVEGEKAVTVTPFTGPPRGGKVVEALPVDDGGDLALVELDDVAGDVALQPAVLLDTFVADHSAVEAVGYPADEVDRRPGQQPLTYRATPRRADAAEVLGLVLAGSQVTGGLSGAPVLNLETGAVVGVVRYTKNDSNDLGGGAIPIAVAIKAFDRVAKLHMLPSAASREWITTLGERWLRPLGREPLGTNVCFDLRLGGTPDQWKVTSAVGPVDLNVGKLGDRVPQALFHWARHRQVRERRDLKILGRFLSAALLHDTIGVELGQRRGGASELLVRLAFDENCDLADVPWEYATTSNAEDSTFLGTDERLALVRIVPGGPERMPDPDDNIRVLGVVVQPPEFTALHPSVMGGGVPIPWTTTPDLVEKLRRAVTGPGPDAGATVTFDSLVDPTFGALPEHDPEAPVHVVHYIGYGLRQERDGDHLAFSDGYESVSFTPVAEFLQAAAKLRPKLIVVETATLPPTKDWAQMSRSAFVSTLPAPVAAIVATRFPVHPREYDLFNRAFYESVRKGVCVELAVQAGRRNLAVVHPINDWTSFGAFAVFTGATGGLRLLERPERPDGEQRGGTSKRAPDTPPAPPSRPEGSADEFSIR
jgi:hypothetical protein